MITDVIAVSNHVGYECGDQEAFDTPETWARAQWYQVYAIPDVRVDGKYSVVGAATCSGAYNAYLSRVRQRQEETSDLSPIEIDGEYHQNPVELRVTARFRLVDPVSLTDLQATILVYEDGIHESHDFYWSEVWNEVVRRILNQPITLANPGDVATVELAIPLEPDWNPGTLHLVAFVQRTSGDKEVYQAARLGANASGTDLEDAALAAGIASCRPNPFHAGTEITFMVAEPGPVHLEIFDIAGRKVASLYEGGMRAGPQSRFWDGCLAGGEPARNGLYFARLRTRAGSDTRKLILMRD